MTDRKRGLPDLSPEATDTNEKLSTRVDEVRRLLRDVWTAAVEQIGGEEAKRLWEATPNEKNRNPRKKEED